MVNVWLSPSFFILCALILGLLVGSFLNVVIYRLPNMLERQWRAQCVNYVFKSEPCVQIEPDARPYNLATPASHCPQCKISVRLWHNIPLFSYIVLRGCCAHCKTPISLRYPLFELITGLLFATLAWHFGPSWQFAGYLVLTAFLVALTGIDVDTQLLPDDLTLPLVWIGLLFNLITHTVPLQDAVTGAVMGYLSLWLVYQIFKLATQKEGMGYGDFKLLAALGAWLGWSMLPLIILLSSLMGAIVGITLILLAKHGPDQPLPFGPYLAAAGWVTLIWGPQMLAWYLDGLRVL